MSQWLVSLEDSIVDRIADAVVAKMGNGPSTSWLTRQEAAEHLRCSTKQLDKYVREGVPVYRPGGPTGRPLFKREDLDSFVDTNRRDY